MSNEPAFPTNFNMSTFEHDNQGMTLRDYFAAAALQGIVANGEWSSCESLVGDSYRVADAMLQARATQ